MRCSCTTVAPGPRLPLTDEFHAPMTTAPPLSDRLQTAEEPDPCMARRDDLEILSVAGPDAPTFLQGQCTADVQGLAAGSWTWAGYCTPKGRLLSVFRVGRSETGYTLEVPAGTATGLATRLRKFVLRSKVTFAEAEASTACLWIQGCDATTRWCDALGLPPIAPGTFHAFDGGVVFGTRDGLVAHIAPAGAEAALAAVGPEVRRVDAALAIRAEILEGAPWIETAVEDAFVPQMVGLDRIGGVSFTKGCYPGQEIVARTRYLGTVKRHLYVIALGAAAQPGDAILSGDQSVGTVLRSTGNVDHGVEALAVIEGSAADGGELRTAVGPVTGLWRVHPDE